MKFVSAFRITVSAMSSASSSIDHLRHQQQAFAEQLNQLNIHDSFLWWVNIHCGNVAAAVPEFLVLLYEYG
jgi:hypothetical protein